MKNNADQNRQACDREADDRNVIKGHMEMGRREKVIHG